MPRLLPTLLGKQPLLEAICEFRVSPANGSLSNVLPGYLYTKCKDDGSLHMLQLPGAALDESIRQQDASLAYVPTMQIAWRDFLIAVGPRHFALACKLPYPGWAMFRAAILEIAQDLFLNSGLVHGIDRYSLKYVNFFPATAGQRGRTDVMDWSLRVGDAQLVDEPVQLRVEFRQGEILTVLNALTQAVVKRANDVSQAQGCIVDVDTIHTFATDDLVAFANGLDTRLNLVRLINKRAFFDSLTDATIASMEPIYDASESIPTGVH